MRRSVREGETENWYRGHGIQRQYAEILRDPEIKRQVFGEKEIKRPTRDKEAQRFWDEQPEDKEERMSEKSDKGTKRRWMRGGETKKRGCRRKETKALRDDGWEVKRRTSRAAWETQRQVFGGQKGVDVGDQRLGDWETVSKRRRDGHLKLFKRFRDKY